MIDSALGLAIVQQMHQHWIGPELEARMRAGTLPVDFHIKRCLIRLPGPGSTFTKPIVEFNKEVHLLANVKMPTGVDPKPHDIASLEDIEFVDRVYPPEVDGVRVAFLFAQWIGGHYSVFFDLRVNNDRLPIESDQEWWLGRPIASNIHSSMVELALEGHRSVESELVKIGLWAAPALLPHPLNKIVSLVKVGSETEARQLLINHCTAARLTALVSSWRGNRAFEERLPLFEEALFAHVQRKFYLSVSTLTPHLEGVVTDWLHVIIPNFATELPQRMNQGSKTKRFRDEVNSSPNTTPAFRHVVQSALSFILDGPVLATFREWFASFDNSFVNRHIMGHGRFDPLAYSEENSVKLFLMLDTLHQIIAIHGESASNKH